MFSTRGYPPPPPDRRANDAKYTAGGTPLAVRLLSNSFQFLLKSNILILDMKGIDEYLCSLDRIVFRIYQSIYF